MRLFHQACLCEEQQNNNADLSNIESSIPPEQDCDYCPKKKSRTEDNSQSDQLEEPNEKYCTSIQSKENVSTISPIAGKRVLKY